MRIPKIILLLLILFPAPGISGAQVKKNKLHGPVRLQQFIPFFHTYLGDFPSGIYSADTLERILGSGLSARDQSGSFYRVFYFEFGYQHTDTTYNDTTGMPKLVNDYVSFTFYSPRLDTLWLHRIRGEMVSGDTLFFDNVLAEDSRHRLKYRVPSLKFGIR